MISLTTHTLDSSTGNHAAGVSIKLFALTEDKKLTELWSKATDSSGRLQVEFEIFSCFKDCDLQLSFNIGNYFEVTSEGVKVKSVNLNIELPDPDGSYHFPIIISPYGASFWWSN